MRTFVIAEIGVNHNGRLDLALELIERAHAAGADAAKFQTFRADALVAPNTAKVSYQRRAPADGDQGAMLRALELSYADHRRLAQRCRELGIEFMSTAFDLLSLDFLVELGMRRIKIPSGEITNVPYLEACAHKGLPILLSTGMATMDEVRDAVAVIRDGMKQTKRTVPGDDLVVLHCTSAYPTDFDDVNLRAMVRMGEELSVPVGYSDHTSGTLIASVAVALGAQVIEKHLTLDRGLPGPDHSASLEPKPFAEMVAAIRSVEAALGDGIKQPRPAEAEARKLVRRGLKASRALTSGTVLTADDIAILRPETGLPPVAFEAVIGRRLAIAMGAGEPIEDECLAP